MVRGDRMNATPGPILNQLNVVARDWDASLAFYRLLGLELSVGGEWPAGSGARHASVSMRVDGVTLEFDNAPMLRQYAEDAANVRGPVIGFAYPDAEAVDATVERLQAAGHPVRQRPYDAFWGARYAIVEDPDGNAIGLMGPIDRSRQYVPGPRA
jgi:catechol 2,3-dioxygenase-like lactoylglutathione lyase family enzyme